MDPGSAAKWVMGLLPQCPESQASSVWENTASEEECGLGDPQVTLRTTSLSSNCGMIFLQQHRAEHENGRGAGPGVQEAGV